MTAKRPGSAAARLRTSVPCSSVCALDEANLSAASSDYAVVVLDLMMPRIDGFGVIKYLRERAPSLFDRIIVMTAFGPMAAEKVCPPVIRFIHKPFDISRLLDEAMEAAASRSVAAEEDQGASS